MKLRLADVSLEILVSRKLFVVLATFFFRFDGAILLISIFQIFLNWFYIV